MNILLSAQEALTVPCSCPPGIPSWEALPTHTGTPDCIYMVRSVYFKVEEQGEVK